MRRTLLLIVGVGAACALLLLTNFVRSNVRAAQGRGVGTWRDITLDKLKHLSADDKKRMQCYLTFRADGGGAYITGGMRRASTLNALWRPQSLPIKWSVGGNSVTFTPDGKSFFGYELSPDGRVLTSTDGNNIRYERFPGAIPAPDQPAA